MSALLTPKNIMDCLGFMLLIATGKYLLDITMEPLTLTEGFRKNTSNTLNRVPFPSWVHKHINIVLKYQRKSCSFSKIFRSILYLYCKE